MQLSLIQTGWEFKSEGRERGVIIWIYIFETAMDKTPVFGGRNNPVNRRKDIESEINLREMIIIDNGTETVKIGRSGSDYPSIIINTVTGIPHSISENDAIPPKKMYFGKELAQLMESKKYNIEFSYPISNSKISEKNIDEMVALWGYAISELMGVDLGSASLLVIDSPINSKEYKSELVEVLFEKLKVESVLFMNSSVLSLFSIGETIGLVTEIGEGTTTVVPVFEGFILNHALEKSQIAGREITDILKEQIKINKIPIDGKDELEVATIIKKMKEQNVRAAYDYDNELSNDRRTEEEKSYELPDGTVIQLTKETVHRPAEILFTGKESQKSLQDMIKTSLGRCSEDLKIEMAKRMVFCGGSSMVTGLYDRIDKELNNLGVEYRLEFDWQRRYSAWVGGSMIGSLSTFQQLAIKITDHPTTNEIIKKIF